MKTSTKTELATLFLSDLADMRRDRLQDIVGSIIGEELATVMYSYARQVIEANPNNVVENASSLMILGYLIRAHEEGGIPPATPPV